MLTEALRMGYGGGTASGSRAGDQGFREIRPRCKPGPDFEACRRDLLIEGAGLTVWVVATIAVVGGARGTATQSRG